MTEFPYIDKLKRHLKDDDVLVFYNKSNRSENGYNNDIREGFILNFQLIPLLAINSNYIDKWTYMYISICNLIDDLIHPKSENNLNYTNVSLTHKGGRGYNHDYELKAILSNQQHITMSVELKCNAIPQIISIYCHSDIFDTMPYIRYYFDEWIPKIVTDTSIQIPNFEDYTRDINITDVNKTKHPKFFKWLKDNPNNLYVNESIKTFLTEYKDKLNLLKLSDKLIKSQSNKTFAIWNTENLAFSIKQSFNETDLKLIKLDPIIKNGNTLIAYSANHRFKLLLRWKNHKGCLGPAWQISIDNKI